MPRILNHDRRSFSEILGELHECGFLTQVERESETCFVSDATTTWSQCAKQASSISNGLWHPHHSGLRWQNGRQSFYVVASSAIAEIRRCKAIAEKLTGATCGYSYGSGARAMLKWAWTKCEATERDRIMLDGGFVGYHECAAGKYDNAIHYDAKGCYYQLICRLESLNCGLDKTGKMRFYKPTPDTVSKWNEALEVVENEKLLRNSIWGCMLGSTGDRIHFFNGQRRMSNSYDGTHYAAAALVARSAWELCQAAAIETQSYYAQTDGIICKMGYQPFVWNRVGLQYRIKARGDAHIIRQHNWRCGGAQTKWYDSRDFWPENNPRPSVPNQLFYSQWM